MDNNALLKLVAENPSVTIQDRSRNRFVYFAKYINPKIDISLFHRVYYELLELFALGKIKNLIISSPAQHGKSQGSSRFLPAFMLGLDPDKKIALGSYSSGFAQDFNRDVQKIIDSPEYRDLFPDTYLNRSNNVSGTTYKRNMNVIEMVKHEGFFRVAGRSGALTGVPVDVMIMDDLYRDAEEGNSPVVRDRAWGWYTSVVRKRLHNDSQQLIVFTRWHEDDIIGRIESTELVVTISSLEQIKHIPKDAWVKVNFPALKVGDPTPLDPREDGVALWEERHSKRKHIADRKLNRIEFECMSQGNPSSSDSLLYGRKWLEYNPGEKEMWGILIGVNNYTDVADTGEDYLCSVCYEIRRGKDERGYAKTYCLVTDIIHTDQGTNVTLYSVPEMLDRNDVRESYIESNSGGSTFATVIEERVRFTRITPFYQSKNKESRILTNAATVVDHIVMPSHWQDKWEDFYRHLTGYKRSFSANKFHDASDVVTGIVEKEIIEELQQSGVSYSGQYYNDNSPSLL